MVSHVWCKSLCEFLFGAEGKVAVISQKWEDRYRFILWRVVSLEHKTLRMHLLLYIYRLTPYLGVILTLPWRSVPSS